MAAYAEGLNILKHANLGKTSHEHEKDAETTPLRNPEHYQYDFNLADVSEVWRRGSVISSWLLDLTAQAFVGKPEPRQLRGQGLRLRRGTLDRRRGQRPRRARARADGVAVRALCLARAGRLPEPRALRDALRLRWPRGEEVATVWPEPAMTTENPFRVGLQSERAPSACVFVIFGASGDLAHRKLLPALYNLAVSRLLPAGMSIVGFASDGARRGRVPQEHARRSSGVLAPQARSTRPCGRTSPAASTTWPASSRTRRTSSKLREKLEDDRRGQRHSREPPLLPRRPAERVPHGQRQPRHGGARGRSRGSSSALRASSSRSPSATISRAATRSTRTCTASSTRPRSSASTTTSARRRSRTSSRSASATRSASRSGTASTSTTCRSRWPRTSASRGAASSTRRPGRRATSCRTTCSSSSGHGDGAARRLHRRRGARREGQGAARAQAHPRRRTSRAHRARPVRPGQLRGQAVPGYREEPNVSPTSIVETFVAMRIEVDNWRLAGVPFYIRAGKRLTKRITEISVHFKQRPARAALRRQGPRRARRPRHPHPARRGHRPALHREGAGADDDAAPGDDGLPLRRDLRRQRPRGVRAAHPRRDARRPDALRARRRGERGVAVHHAHPRGVGEASAPPRASRTTRQARGGRARRRSSSSATGARGGGYEAVARPRSSASSARLWEQESRALGRRARGAPHAGRARQRAAPARARAERVVAERRARSSVAHDRRRVEDGAAARDHGRRRAPPAWRRADRPAGMRSRSRPSALRASGCPGTPTASPCPTCPSASGGWATCPTSTICSIAWWSARTSSSSTRRRWICATSRSSRVSRRARSGRYALADLTWIRLRSLQDLVARFFDDEQGRACLPQARARRHRVLATPGRSDAASTRSGSAVRLDRATRWGCPARSADWKRGEGWAEVTAGRTCRPVRAHGPSPSVRPGGIVRVAIECKGPASRSSARTIRRPSAGLGSVPGCSRRHPQCCDVQSAGRVRRCCSSASSVRERDGLLETSLHVASSHRTSRGARGSRPSPARP